MLMHRSGRSVASAILLIPMVEELLARTAPAGATRSSSAKIERLRSTSSNTASMTNSLPFTASPDLVVVDGKPEQPDLQVAQAHHGLGLGADGESALRLEAVVDDELAALEIERHAFVDVGHEDADPRNERIEIALLLWMGADVGFDQPPEHRGEGARLVIRVFDEPATFYVEFEGGLYFSSGHSTGTRVVHSVISWDAFA